MRRSDGRTNQPTYEPNEAMLDESAGLALFGVVMLVDLKNQVDFDSAKNG